LIWTLKLMWVVFDIAALCPKRGQLKLRTQLMRGYPKGSRVVPLDFTGMISYSSLIVPKTVSCTVSEIYLTFDRSKIGIFGYPSCV